MDFQPDFQPVGPNIDATCGLGPSDEGPTLRRSYSSRIVIKDQAGRMHAARLLLLLRLLNPVNATYLCEGDAQEECYQWRDWPDEGLREPAAYSAAPCPLPNLHNADLALDDVKHARPDTTCTPFYLNEDGTFDMSILQACWEHAHELTPNSRQVDNRVNPERA